MNDHQRLTNLTTELTRITTLIETNGHDLIRRGRIPTGPDGYPHRASGAQPGDGTTSTRHDTHILVNLDHTWTWTCSCDTTGDTYPNEYLAVRAADDHANGHSTLDYADPTGDAAVAPTQPDPVRTSARRLLRHLEKAHLELATALAIIPITPAGDAGEPECYSCARADRYYEPAIRHGLCDFCDTYRQKTSRLPSLVILRKKHRGERLYDRDLKTAN